MLKGTIRLEYLKEKQKGNEKFGFLFEGDPLNEYFNEVLRGEKRQLGIIEDDDDDKKEENQQQQQTQEQVKNVHKSVQPKASALSMLSAYGK